MDIKRLVRDPAYFMEELCVVPQGKFRLEGWQKKLLKKLVDEDGQYRKRFMILCLPKKSGKTTFSSLLMLWVLLRKPDSLVLLAAGGSRQQSDVLSYAKICYAILSGHDWLRNSCQVFKDRIATSTGGICRTVGTRGQSAAGVETDGLLIDEVWAMSDQQESLFSELISPPPMLRESLTIVASYPGLGGEDSLLGRLIALAEKNPNMLLLHSHNPMLSSWIDKEYIEEMKQILLPSQFRRLFHAEFVGPETSFLDYESQWLPIVDSGLKPLQPDKSKLVFVGVDSALRRDSAAIVVIWLNPETNLIELAYCRVFAPKHGRELDLTDTLGATVRMLADSFTIANVLYDPRFFKILAQQLEHDLGVRFTEISQSRQTMSPIVENLRQMILSGKLRLYPSELDKHIRNCAISEHSQGVTIQSLRRGLAIDGVIALSLACWGCRDIGARTVRVFTLYDSQHPMPVRPVPTSSSWRYAPPFGRRRPRSPAELIREASQ